MTAKKSDVEAVSFIHMGDSHLGYFRYPKGDVNGINQRMMDFHNVFLQAVDKAIAAKPDFIIHAGDIVDSSNPPNRSREVMAEGLYKVYKANIPLIVLSGTHDTPKTKRDINPFNLFKYDDIHMITGPEKVVIDVNGKKVNVYGVPYSYDFEEMRMWFDETEAEQLDEDAYNILVMHCDIGEVDKLKYSDRLITLPDNIGDRFDYVALGHFHSYHHWKGKKNVVFAGATERKNYDEIGEDRYIHKVEMSKGSEVKIDNIKLDIRPMAKIIVDLSKVSDIEEAYKAIKKSAKKSVESSLDGVILPIVLKCRFDLWKSLNMPYIKGLFPNAFWCDPSWDNIGEVKVENVSSDISGNILNEWQKWIDGAESDKEVKKWCYVEGTKFLGKAIEANDSN